MVSKSRSKKYQPSPSSSYDTSDQKSFATGFTTEATPIASYEEDNESSSVMADSRYSKYASEASSVGDVSLNSSDIADIVKESGKSKRKKKKKSKLNDNYLNNDTSDGGDDYNEDDKSTKSNLSKASSKASSKRSTSSCKKKLTSSLSISSSKGSSKNVNEERSVDQDAHSTTSKSIKSNLSLPTTPEEPDIPETKEIDTPEAESVTSSSSISKDKYITKKKKTHQGRLKLQTYEYYGEECFEMVKTEATVSDDEEEEEAPSIKSQKSNGSIASRTSQVSDNQLDSSVAKSSVAKSSVAKSSNAKSSTAKSSNAKSSVAKSSSVSHSNVDDAERQKEDLVVDDEPVVEEKQPEVEIEKFVVESSPSNVVEPEKPQEALIKEESIKLPVETEKTSLEENANTTEESIESKKKSRKAKVFSYTKKALLASSIKAKKKLMKSATTSENAESSSNSSQRKPVSFGNFKKRITFKQKKLLTSKSKEKEEVVQEISTDEKVPDIQEDQPEQVKEEKAVIITETTKHKEEKKHILDEICKDDLTHLISALTMSMASADEEESIPKRINPDKAKTTQKEISKLLAILEAKEDNNSATSEGKNRYSMSFDSASKKEEDNKSVGDVDTRSLIETLKSYKPEEQDDKTNEDLAENIQKLSDKLVEIENDHKEEDTQEKAPEENAEQNVEENTEQNVEETSSPVPSAKAAVATLSPIETTIEEVNPPSSAIKKKKSFSMSPRKIKKKFVRFKEHLESPRSLGEEQQQSELSYETVKMIVVTASIILQQSRFDVKSAEEASALMLEEELIKLSVSKHGKWFKLKNGVDKKDASNNAVEVSSLAISALCSGIGTIQASELAVQTLRSKGYKVTEKVESEEEEDIVLVQEDQVQEEVGVAVDDRELKVTNSLDLVLETYPAQKSCLASAACCITNGNSVPKEVIASPKSSPKKKKKHVEDEDTADDNKEESSAAETSSLEIISPKKNKKLSSKKRNINVYHISANKSETTPERSEFSSEMNTDESSIVSKSDSKTIEEQNHELPKEDKSQLSSTNTARLQSKYIAKCAEYDQPAFDDYMTKIYYQMVEDIEKYKVYHDVVNVFKSGRVYVENKCMEAPCCAGGVSGTTTIDETTYNVDTLGDTCTLETNTIGDTTLNDTLWEPPATVEDDIRNEMETKAVIAGDDLDTGREGATSPQQEKVEKNPVEKEDEALISNEATKVSQLKKQSSMNMKLFKGFKKVF